jgi:hypothetical protein
VTQSTGYKGRRGYGHDPNAVARGFPSDDAPNPFRRDDDGDGDLGPYDEGVPTKADMARWKAQAKADPANANPSRSSTAGFDEDLDLPTAADIAQQNRNNDAKRSTPLGSSSPLPNVPTPSRTQVTNGARRLLTGQGPDGRRKGNLAGFVFGFFLVAIALNMLEHGPAAGWTWVKAKFINEVPSGTGTASTATGASTSNVVSGFSTALDAVATMGPTVSSTAPTGGQGTYVAGAAPAPSAAAVAT